jgi:hypothetical protein
MYVYVRLCKLIHGFTYTGIQIVKHKIEFFADRMPTTYPNPPIKKSDKNESNDDLNTSLIMTQATAAVVTYRETR